jgi:hypothetical protein
MLFFLGLLLRYKVTKSVLLKTIYVNLDFVEVVSRWKLKGS